MEFKYIKSKTSFFSKWNIRYILVSSNLKKKTGLSDLYFSNDMLLDEYKEDIEYIIHKQFGNIRPLIASYYICQSISSRGVYVSGYGQVKTSKFVPIIEIIRNKHEPAPKTDILKPVRVIQRYYTIDTASGTAGGSTFYPNTNTGTI